MNNELWFVLLVIYTCVILFVVKDYRKKIQKVQKQSDYWHDLVHTLNDLSGEKTKDYLALRDNRDYWKEQTFDAREIASKRWAEVKELKALLSFRSEKKQVAKKVVKKISQKKKENK